MKNQKISKILNKKGVSPITCLTAYSKSTAQVASKFCDIILVGDSLGMTLYGMKTTRNIKLETMMLHCKTVKNFSQNSLVVCDMPYKTYTNKKIAYKNALKVLTFTKCDAIKLEGGSSIANVIEYLIKNKIPVMGHLGILPQSVKGKFKSKGKKPSERKKILKDAKTLQKIGVFSIVLECVEKTLSKEITNILKIPTIGIGSSNHCDGQVLVLDDLIGLHETKIKFVKKFGNVKKNIRHAVVRFKKQVLSKKYPTKKYSY